jgi:hypothetical protein
LKRATLLPYWFTLFKRREVYDYLTLRSQIVQRFIVKEYSLRSPRTLRETQLPFFYKIAAFPNDLFLGAAGLLTLVETDPLNQPTLLPYFG